MTYKKLQTNFERELLFCLIFNMKKGQITRERGQQVSREFLQVLKNETTIEGFMQNLSRKAEFYPEIREAFLIVAEEFEAENIKENLIIVRERLRAIN